ncbi:MAG: ABC transporter permease, partial [Burkholderiales bacterium]|nr:ABC transporter permease [Burkholderiales bacterium]
MARVVLRLAPWISVAAVALAWELFARSGAVTPYMLPRFTTVMARIGTDALSGELWHNLGLSLYRSMLGFLLASVIGIGLGFAVSQNRVVRWLLDPLISVGFPMPKIAFLP